MEHHPEQSWHPKPEEAPAKADRSLGLAKHLHAEEQALEDRQWWTQFKLGSETAFSKIFLRYHPVLLQYGRSLVLHETWIEDAIQDLFVELWQTRSRLGDVESVKYYLVVSLRRKLLRLNESHKRMRLLLERARYEHADFESSAEKWLILMEKDQALNFRISRCIEQLPASQKRALELRYFENNSYDEIAAAMCINARSARKFVYKAIKALRKSLK
jgi:RNA polymerase sigma-70 factor (ECF subfamily)